MMEEIINSVMQSPENTNPNVLRSQLQSVGGSSSGIKDIGIAAVGEGSFELSEKMTMSELYNNVSNGTRFYIVPTIPEQEGIIVHDHKFYLFVQMVSHITKNGNEVYLVYVLNNQYNLSLYLYNAAGSNEVVISEKAPN